MVSGLQDFWFSFPCSQFPQTRALILTRPLGEGRLPSVPVPVPERSHVSSFPPHIAFFFNPPDAFSCLPLAPFPRRAPIPSLTVAHFLILRNREIKSLANLSSPTSHPIESRKALPGIPVQRIKILLIGTFRKPYLHQETGIFHPMVCFFTSKHMNTFRYTRTKINQKFSTSHDC